MLIEPTENEWKLFLCMMKINKRKKTIPHDGASIELKNDLVADANMVCNTNFELEEDIDVVKSP